MTVVNTVEEMGSIDNGDHLIEFNAGAQFIIDKECLDHRPGVSKPGCFNDNAIKGLGPFQQTGNNADQITAHRAADTAIIHFKDFFIDTDNQIVINTDFPEFINDNSVILVVVFSQNAVQQCCLSRPEVSG